MVRVCGEVGRAAAAAAAAAAELGLPADLQAAPAALRQVAQLPAAVQKMYCNARDVDEFHEQAGAVIEAYNKALEAGALESTAERTAAAVAYKIDPGYREYLEHDKQWKLERCEAAAVLEKLAMQARRVVKKARRLVSRGLPKRLQGPCEDAFAPRRAMNIAHAILREAEGVYMYHMGARYPSCFMEPDLGIWRALGIGPHGARSGYMELCRSRGYRVANVAGA